MRRIHDEGVSQLFVGVEIERELMAHPNGYHWPVYVGEEQIGKMTSAVYSPRLKKNVGLALLQIGHTEMGTHAVAQTPMGSLNVTVVPKPFYDPKKKLASG